MVTGKQLKAAILARRAAQGPRKKCTRPKPRQYTVADLERARDRVAAAERRIDNDRRSNPNVEHAGWSWRSSNCPSSSAVRRSGLPAQPAMSAWIDFEPKREAPQARSQDRLQAGGISCASIDRDDEEVSETQTGCLCRSTGSRAAKFGYRYVAADSLWQQSL